MESRLCSLILLSASKNALRKAVFSKPKDKSIQKLVLSPIMLGGSASLQAETFHTDNKATHKNFSLSEDITSELCSLMQGFSQVNLLTSQGDCEYRVSSKGKVVMLGADKLWRKLEDSQTLPVASVSNNREKKYILNGSEPFLIRLGVSDANGRVFDKKQPKFRQINRFLELVRDVEDSLPKESIRICDLCCGKSYLSFAV